MGALIATKGTRRLINKLNQAFSKAQMKATKAKIDGDGTLRALFANPSGNAPIVQSICNHPKGKALFLPPHDATNHKNLLKRWDWYLANELQHANHELIRGFIWNVINGPNGLQGVNSSTPAGDVYTAIRFDCVEGANQTVLASDEYHLKNSDKDDTGLSKVTAYLKIVLVTAPTTAPHARDPQF
jgi:hypothetical protein